MDGQQVFVTGADGEQMVLSGPEAAALLAQAGISLGDQEGAEQAGAEVTGEQPVTQEQGEAAVTSGAEEGNILVPPGSSVAEDGSIIAADGTILAPAGTVSIGPDGTLMMSENSALLSDPAPVPVSSTGEQVYTTPDGMTIKAGEGDILTDGDGNFLTDEAGNILTTAHLSALGAVAVDVGTGDAMTSAAPSLNTGDTPMISADGLQSDGHFLRTADGNLLTDEEGNFITPDGNVIKPEEAHKILASQEAAAAELANASEPSSGEVLQAAAGEILQNVGGQVLQNSSDEILQTVAGDSTGADAAPADAIITEDKSEGIATSESMIISKPVNESIESLDEPPQLEVRRSSVDLPAVPPVESTDVENNAIEPEKSKTEIEQPMEVVPEVEPVLPESQEAVSLASMPLLDTEEAEGNIKTPSDGPSADQETTLPAEDPSVDPQAAETEPLAAAMSADPVPVSSAVTSPVSADILAVATQQEAAELAVSQALATATAEVDSSVAATLSNSEPDQLPVVSQAEVAVSLPMSMASVTASLPVELSLPSSSDGGIYTTADGRVLSLPEGIVTNQSGHLINPADGSILTTEDGTPLMLPEGAILQGAPEGAVVASDVGLSTTSGGIMVSSGQTQSDILSTVTSSIGAPVPASVPVSSVQLTQSPDGTMIAPEGSMIASDGSILAADGTMLAPPGSVSLTPEPLPQVQLPTQPTNPPIPASLAPTEPLPSQPQNLIGLQLPESGEVLYLDPNDPAAQQLLQEAGISLGDNGVLQTLDGQVLQGEDGNPITANTSKAPASVTSFANSPTKHNNIVTGALAAAGLVDTSDIDIPLSHGVVTDIRPNLPSQPVSYNQLTADDAIRQHLSQLQPRYTPPAKQTKQAQTQQKTQYKKLTFNSGAAGPSYASPAAPASIPKRSIAPKQRRTVPNTDLQIGPDQQKVTYTVTSENGYTQTYMMICSKSLDQNTLINTLIKNISSDPNHKGKKTIKITQHKYGAKKATKQPAQRSYNGPNQQQAQARQIQNNIVRNQANQGQRLAPAPGPQQRVVQQVQYRPVQAATASPAPVKQQSPLKPPQQLLESDQDVGDFANNLSLDDIMKQVVDQTGSTTTNTEDKDPKVMVRCNYCTSFKCALNSQTWENILNHILPVAKEELYCSFYGNILKHFARGLRVSVSGGREQCEVVVNHGLVCRRTGTWFSVDKPGVDLATNLATHVAAVQPGVNTTYGARPRGNNLICLFNSSPYTPEDYVKHLRPHEEFIKPVLLLAAGAYCATSFETLIPKDQDLRFLPTSKFAPEFNCKKKLQATVDCFRENFDSRGFLQVSNSAMTKCSVCRTPNNTYCALFKPSAATAKIFGGSSEEMLAVCASCQKQFVNVVMRENSFEKQLKMFQLHHMEQLCGMLRVLLSASQAICSRSHNLLYTVQEGGSLYSASNTLHTVAPAKIVMNPLSKVSRLEEDKSLELKGCQMRYCCDQCKFSIDLTRLQHGGDKSSHLVDMAVGVVLEHIVPHTESLMAVIMTAAFNEVFNLKFEFTATVEGEGINKKIIIGLDRKIVGVGESQFEVTLQKDVQKSIEMLKTKLKQDKKGNVSVKKRHIFMDTRISDTNQDSGQLVEAGRFLEAASNVLKLYGSCGCNTKLLDFYAECRLCGKFSFPDFRLTAAIRSKEGVALCENCCETILSLCVPSEPEKVAGRGDVCLLLGQERNVGHRLVLSNNTKKWISAEGVERISAVSAIANNCQLPDYSTHLVQLLKSHLQAVAERAWTDPSCMTARAGFAVTPPDPSKQFPIEVKVTIRPPKTKTPPSKLVITPVNVKPAAASSSLTPTPGSTRLVKITANRRIIPVRDPTSINTGSPGTLKDNKQKLATVQARRVSAGQKLTPKSAQANAKASLAAKADKEEEIDSDLEKEDDFESIDAIANFISSSEPLVKKVKSEAAPSNEVTDVLTDEFTDSSLSTPKAGAQSNGNDRTPESRLPKTEAGNLDTPDAGAQTEEADEDKPTTASSNGEVSDKDFNLPPGLVISPANAQLKKGSGSNKADSDKMIELGSPKTEVLPSPASDATTSTKVNSNNEKPWRRLPTNVLEPILNNAKHKYLQDTVTPSKSALVTTKGRKPQTPRSISSSEEEVKTSTVSSPLSNNGRQSKRDNGVGSPSSIDIDLDNEDLEDDEANNESGGGNKTGVKLSSILPKPRRGRPPGSTNKPKPPGAITGKNKLGDKRKRSVDLSADEHEQSKKAKLSEDDEDSPATPESGIPDLSGTSSSGRVRRARKMFDL